MFELNPADPNAKVMSYTKLRDFVGKEVRLCTGDNQLKRGIIHEISDIGFIIEITISESKHYDVGEIVFISHSAGLILKK